MSSSAYIGRFAPSPTGPLHFGSLVTAVASYLDAKSQGGIWLVRMEDIDPPREQQGAKSLILKTLETYGLFSDRDIVFQSDRLNAYQKTLEQLENQQQIFSCVCTRKSMTAHQTLCRGQCCLPVKKSHLPFTLRFYPALEKYSFLDRIYGKQTASIGELGYCTLKRKDGLFAYQLAVVTDDIGQGITHVVRGADLIQPTHWQLGLFDSLKSARPVYAHIPLAMGNNGKKLSKQYGAPGIPLDHPQRTLFKAFKFLQLAPPSTLEKASLSEILEWGVEHWKLPVANRYEQDNGEK